MWLYKKNLTTLPNILFMIDVSAKVNFHKIKKPKTIKMKTKRQKDKKTKRKVRWKVIAHRNIILILLALLYK